MDGLTNWLSEWGGWLLGLTAAVVAIRGSVKFDVNQWLNDRREKYRKNYDFLCPHAYSFIDPDSGKVGIRSLFTSPSGTTSWICESCGCVVYTEESVMHILQSWLSNPKGLLEVEKKRNKLYDKLQK